jgi:hypothetical protein
MQEIAASGVLEEKGQEVIVLVDSVTAEIVRAR